MSKIYELGIDRNFYYFYRERIPNMTQKSDLGRMSFGAGEIPIFELRSVYQFMPYLFS